MLSETPVRVKPELTGTRHVPQLPVSLSNPILSCEASVIPVRSSRPRRSDISTRLLNVWERGRWSWGLPHGFWL